MATRNIIDADARTNFLARLEYGLNPVVNLAGTYRESAEAAPGNSGEVYHNRNGSGGAGHTNPEPDHHESFGRGVMAVEQPTTREVPLTRGLIATVDASDYDLVISAGTWHGVQRARDRTAYAQRAFPRAGGGQRTVMLHAFITGWARVDHINGDGLDNRRVNLRPATHAQNMRNKRPYRNNTSGFKGVKASRNRWMASIGHDCQVTYLGTFDTREGAAEAYDDAARRFFGEWAALNFPRPGERAALSSRPGGDA